MAKKMNVVLRSLKIDQYFYTGQVWPGEVYYVDFLHPNASLFWQTQLEKMYKQMNFSGIWLDMNEPTNFKVAAPTDEKYLIQKNENMNTMTIDCNLQHYR